MHQVIYLTFLYLFAIGKNLFSPQPKVVSSPPSCSAKIKSIEISLWGKPNCSVGAERKFQGVISIIVARAIIMSKGRLSAAALLAVAFF